MAKHPESQDRVREEIAAVFGRTNNAELSVADLDSMPYTEAALKVFLYFWAILSFQ